MASSATAPVPVSRDARRVVFGLTWLSYASYYLARKGFGVTKARIESTLGVSAGWLALIDTAYLISYATGQFLSGLAGDRVGARRLIGWGMLGSAAACALFGFSSGAIVMLLAFAAVNLLVDALGNMCHNQLLALERMVIPALIAAGHIAALILLAAVALAWLLADETIVAPIASARSVSQLEDLLPCATLTLTPEDVDRLSDL